MSVYKEIMSVYTEIMSFYTEIMSFYKEIISFYKDIMSVYVIPPIDTWHALIDESECVMVLSVSHQV